MLTIHGIPISVHTRKVIVTAILKDVPHRVEPVVPFDPPPGWDALSPTGLIPVVTEGDFSLTDSTAICKWLDRRYPNPAILPTDAQALGRTLWFDAYAGGTLYRQVVHGLFFQKVLRPAVRNEPTDQAAVDAILAGALPKILGYLDDQAAGRWLVGETPTLADVAVGSNLVNYHYLGYRIDARLHPRLAAWYRGVTAHPAFRATLAIEGAFAERMGLDRSFLAEAAES